MVIKIYVSGISGNKEVKKRQQRVLLILDSKKLKYDVIDIAEPGAEEAKDFMQNNATGNGATISDQNPRHPLPPQIFNDDDYCGDYNMFDLANEEDRMEEFLKLEQTETSINNVVTTENKIENGELPTATDEKLPEQPQNLETAEVDNSKDEVPNEEESKIEESSKNDDEHVTEETKEDEKVENEEGDTAVENGKEEAEESIREPSPEKAEE